MNDRPDDAGEATDETAPEGAAEDVYSDEEEEEVEQRLRDLGYL